MGTTGSKRNTKVVADNHPQELLTARGATATATNAGSRGQQVLKVHQKKDSAPKPENVQNDPHISAGQSTNVPLSAARTSRRGGSDSVQQGEAQQSKRQKTHGKNSTTTTAAATAAATTNNHNNNDDNDDDDVNNNSNSNNSNHNNIITNNSDNASRMDINYNTAAVGDGNAHRRPTRNPNDTPTNHEPPGETTATDGYVSFSESDDSTLMSGGDGTQCFPSEASSAQRHAEAQNPGTENIHDPSSNLQQTLSGQQDPEADSDMWAWGDDSSSADDKEGRHVGGTSGVVGRNKQREVHVAPANTMVNDCDGIETPGASESRVVIDKLGRRGNTAGMRHSSSSSSDDFEDWANDTEEEEEEDDDDDGDAVYDWTAMDTAESDALHPSEETVPERRSTVSGSTAGEDGSAALKTNVEANPVASKLGLSSPSPPRARLTANMVSRGRNSTALQHARQVRGLGRGRGPKPVIPGRGGRPWYSPVMSQGGLPFARPQGRPPGGSSGALSTAAGGVGKPTSRAGSDGKNTPAVAAVQATAPVRNSPAATAVRPNFTRQATTPSAGGGSSSATMPPAIRGIPPPSTHARPHGDALLQGTAAGRPSVIAITGGVGQHVGSGGGGGGGGGGGSRYRSPTTVDQRLSGGTVPPPRGVVIARSSSTPAASLVGSPSKEEVTVKDTANITRKKAQLPQQENLEHPTPVGGSWLKNRYIVNNYILLEPLGTGSYAEVRLAKEKTSNKLFAVKIMNKDFLKKKQVGKEGTFMDDIKREIAIMKKVHHPNVLRLYEVMDDPKVNKLYLVLEYCKKGDLMNILNGDTRAVTCDPMNDADVWYIMRQIVQGLSFLHLQNIVHGDIKPQNLLVGADNVAKIADFGISKFVQGSEERLQEQAGTPTFMSPELCAGGEYSGQLADVWALGATMYMLRCGKPPFVANQVMALYEKIQNNRLEFPAEVNMSTGLKRLLWAMMEKSSAKRITLEQIVSDPWLQQGDNAYFSGVTATPSSPGLPPGAAKPLTSAAAAAAAGGTAAASPAASHEALGTGGSGGGRNMTRPEAGRGLGFAHHRPPPPILPMHQQGYQAIKVSENEVHESIGGGTTTTGAIRKSGENILQGVTPPVGSRVRSADGGGGGGRGSIKRPSRNRPKPSITEEGAASSDFSASRVDEREGNNGNLAAHGSFRGHLSETEESWKYRSFKKKTEGGEGPKFRGVSIADGGDGVEKVHPRPPGASTSPMLSAHASTAETVQRPVRSRESCSDMDESDDFSDGEADTLFETEPGDVRVSAGHPCSSPNTNLGSLGKGSPHTAAGSRGVGVGSQGNGGAVVARDERQRRRSSEKFDAVMDTLAVQPRYHGGEQRPSASGGDGSRLSPLSSPTLPLPDCSLQGVSVVWSPPSSSSSSASASSLPGGSNARLGLVAAASQRQGKRPSQEDRLQSAAELAAALMGKVDRPYLFQQFALFGVFDGHNGQLCADALSAGIHVAIARQPMFHQSPEKALVQAFESFDRDLCLRQEQEGDGSGSTALVVLFDGRTRRLLVANAGDSRCVASRAGTAARLSSDHRLSRPDERERVTACGGFVANSRINRVLAVSRSFGDVQHKGHSSGLIATPEIVSESAALSGLEFIILATDGLWDIVDDQAAVNFVRLRLSENPDLSRAAKELTKHAFDEGSIDNVSVVLVWFQDSSPSVTSASSDGLR